MRQPPWKLVVLSALLSVVLGVVHATPVLALCYFCVATDPCTGAELNSDYICCSAGKRPICVTHYDGTCCLLEVTVEGCAVNPPLPQQCPP